jgi:hypothetical protein
LQAFVERAPSDGHQLARLCSHRVAPQEQPIPLDRILYGSDEWKRLYRGRAAVEREFGRLNEYALTPLRTRGLARVHADLVMLARLGQALSRARAIPVTA